MGVDLSRPDSEVQFVLRDAIANVMEAMQRNVKIKKSRYKDNVLAHVFSMNTNWYIYMRSGNSKLGRSWANLGSRPTSRPWPKSLHTPTKRAFGVLW